MIINADVQFADQAWYRQRYTLLLLDFYDKIVKIIISYME